ncbi:MAG: adenylate/guanylate cyclase domain-containing protein, partial [Candidatus Promineifilaceae bacterium]
MEFLAAYMPMDRRQALVAGRDLPHRPQGAALFADISGFTPLTELLARELGPKRGAEELTSYLNRVYEALIAELHRYGGSVIGFSGDAITCWFDGDDGRRAAATGLAMQAAMGAFADLEVAAGHVHSLAMKASVAAGPVLRCVAGDPEDTLVDAIAGQTVQRLAAGEHLAARGEVLLDAAAAATLGDGARLREWRQDEASG